MSARTMRREDARKSRAHAAFWDYLAARQTARDLRVLHAKLCELQTGIDFVVWERDQARASSSEQLESQVTELREQIVDLEKRANEAENEAAEAIEAKEEQDAELDTAKARIDVLEQLLEHLGVSGYALEHAVESAFPVEGLKAVLS